MAGDARRYLEKRADLAARPLHGNGTVGVDVVVVIPALAENEHLFQTLDSLAQNPARELARTLVICVVNNRREPLASVEQIRNNQETLARLEARLNDTGPLRLAYVDASTPGCELPDKGGVGSARKIGLDWAVAVLAEGVGESGVLVCLDADTRVEPNYLEAVREAFARPGAWAAVIDYAHEEPASPDEAAAVVCYELFLRYHELGLNYARSPYAFQTVGSTMACTVGAYVAVAGMNQRQAGEDFYFLQQLAKTGPVRRISTTTVHPSGRPSWRVPFGTGQRVRRFLGGGQDEYLLYDPRSYQVLKDWLAAVAQGLDLTAGDLLARAEAICPQLRVFLDAAGFAEVWPGLQKTSPDPARRLAQFHRWFDAFRTVKFLHFLRDNGWPEVEMFCAIQRLLEWSGRSVPKTDLNSLGGDVQNQKRLLAFLRRHGRE